MDNDALALSNSVEFLLPPLETTVGANETERSAIKTKNNPVKSHKKQEKDNIFIILDVDTCCCTPLCR
jgi:hypothetical protein